MVATHPASHSYSDVPSVDRHILFVSLLVGSMVVINTVEDGIYSPFLLRLLYQAS